MLPEQLPPAEPRRYKAGQVCMRSARVQADLIAIASHRLTPEQQKKLREIALELAQKKELDIRLYEQFRAEVSAIPQADLHNLESDLDIDRKIIEEKSRPKK